MSQDFEFNLFVCCRRVKDKKFIKATLKCVMGVSLLSVFLNLFVLISNKTKFYFDVPTEENSCQYVFPIFSILIDTLLLLTTFLTWKKKISEENLSRFGLFGGVVWGGALLKVLLRVTHTLICVVFGIWLILEKNICYFTICHPESNLRKKIVFLSNFYVINPFEILGGLWLTFLGFNTQNVCKKFMKKQRREWRMNFRAERERGQNPFGQAQVGLENKLPKGQEINALSFSNDSRVAQTQKIKICSVKMKKSSLDI